MTKSVIALTGSERTGGAAPWLRELVFGKSLNDKPLPVVVFGSLESAERLRKELIESESTRTDKSRAIQVVALFSRRVSLNGIATQAEKDWRVFQGEINWLKTLAKYLQIEHAILAMPTDNSDEAEQLLRDAREMFKHVVIAPRGYEGQEAVQRFCSRGKALRIYRGKKTGGLHARAAKAGFDFLAAFLLGLLTMPVFLLVALAIAIDSRGAILSRQVRIGQGNRVFTALKFRTIYSDSAEPPEHCLSHDPVRRREEWKSFHKLKDDPRVTRVGRFLRRFSLDELPLIWNVLSQDMSLVGPRPIALAEIEEYGRDYAAYERVRPGLTGLWQVSGHNDASCRQRVEFDTHYAQNWSFGLDAQILARTVKAVISGQGAY